MPRGDKGKYTNKQKRQAEHIAEGYKEKGVSEQEAESRAWATVNKLDGGGKNPGGSGRGKGVEKRPARKGGEQSKAARSTASRLEAAKKGWETRRRNSTRP